MQKIIRSSYENLYVNKMEKVEGIDALYKSITFKNWTRKKQNILINASVQFTSVVQLCLTLQPHEPQHARPPCPSPTPGVQPNPCPSSQWCCPTISSSVTTFCPCSQSLPASESFPMSHLFTSGEQNIGLSASTPVPPMNTQDWSPFGWIGWISLQSKRNALEA